MKSLSCSLILKKVFLITVFTLLAIFASGGAAVADMRTYCQVPPYVVQNIPPNILIIFDNSGSMFDFAYRDDFDVTYDCMFSTEACFKYNYTGRLDTHRYYGYFNPNQWYTYASNRFSPVGTIQGGVRNPTNKPANAWSGDFLNWLTMRRVDILRKIMTGGKPSGGVVTGEKPDASARGIYKRITRDEALLYVPNTYTSGNTDAYFFFTFTFGSGQATFNTTRGNNINGTSTTSIESGIPVNVVVPLPAEGVLQSVVGARARVGLMFYNDPSKRNDGGHIPQGITNASLSAVINQINNTTPDSNTPLGESLWSAVGYFAQKGSASEFSSFGLGAGLGPRYNGGDYSININSDPMNFGSGGQPRYPVCQKNLVMLLTDGEPTEDGKMPEALLNYANGKSVFNCVERDCPGLSGFGYNFPASTLDARNPLGSGLEDVALFMHTNDLRPDVGGFQDLTLYTVFAFGQGSTLLKYAAINGGFERYGSDEMPTPLSAGPPYNWDVDGNGVPDTYFEATDGAELEEAIRNAFTGILRRASSGTAASVLASGEGTGANLLQALYYPRRSMGNDIVTWTGVLQNMWYYLDPFFANATIFEDTDEDKVLDLTKDSIIQFYFDPDLEMTYARKWKSDAEGNPTSVEPSVSFENVKSLWEAGIKLWRKSPDARVIKTTTGSYNPSSGMNSTALINVSAANASVLSPLMLETGPDLDATIKYIAGIDNDNLRSRTVSVGGASPAVWKLGDIVSSTPRIVASVPLNKYDITYNDTSYKTFIDSDVYKNRGMVFAGGNDGMLHAFRLGKLELLWSGKKPTEKARLVDLNPGANSGTGSFGDEAWGFVPKNALPYLKYLKDPNYCHLYYVDLPPYVFDASIGGNATDVRRTDLTTSSWRTVLIGGMRTGGACSTASSCDTCGNAFASSCTGVPANNCVKTPEGGNIGYSSYFALDVTDPENPSLLWEFSHPQLGFATTGPAIVRIHSKNPLTSTPDRSLNGEWYVVFGSGPTGPIDTISHQFLGRSNQDLRFFVLDLKTGALVQTINTEIENAFAGSMVNSVADFELDYQDDAIYVGYVKKESGGTRWNDGGVLRILTRNATPSDTGGWEFTKVIDGIGPVTSGITRLQSKALSINWLFFGTGRYYYEVPAAGDDTTPIMDDGISRRRLFGIKERCFSNNSIGYECVKTLSPFGTPETTFINVTDVARVPSESDANSMSIQGWYIDLDPAGNYAYDNVGRTFNTERVITDPVPTTTGVVYFSTFKPYGDECALGGKSFLWAVRYNTGGTPAESLLKGKALMQLSTASIEQINLSTAFRGAEMGGRRSAGLEGIPPSALGLSLLSAPPPVKRVMHMTER